MAVMITGAAGFIGSALVRRLLDRWPDEDLVLVDLLTYSGHIANLADVVDDPRVEFVHADIADRDAMQRVFSSVDIGGVIHLAAESHVDRSIMDATAFVRTNVMGTVVLLEVATAAWGGDSTRRFHHVSTDEVFGSLGTSGRFSEETPYAPNSPYAASKAASDHFVRAWAETHGLPTVVSNSTNNYGPRQFPEKLIPLVISRALSGDSIPIYGSGANVRDWLYVEDHCDALALVYESGTDGSTYCIGGETELTNLDVVGKVLDEVDRVRGDAIGSSRDRIEFVSDRPGHDFRYAMDTSLIWGELGWRPTTGIDEGVAETVRWYLGHPEWIEAVQGEEHHSFASSWYAR